MATNILPLPYALLPPKQACELNQAFFPFPLSYYGGEEGIRTLKIVKEEMEDLVRRYVVLIPRTVEKVDRGTYSGFRCLVHDENTGITRGLLERIGYYLEESEFTPYNLFWITLRTREEKGKTK